MPTIVVTSSVKTILCSFFLEPTPIPDINLPDPPPPEPQPVYVFDQLPAYILRRSRVRALFETLRTSVVNAMPFYVNKSGANVLTDSTNINLDGNVITGVVNNSVLDALISKSYAESLV